MPLDGEYIPATDSSLLGTVDAPPSTDVALALEQIMGALQGYEHAQEYDSINLWEQNMLSREGRTLRQADIEFDPNLCSPVIDAVNNKLLISSVTATSGGVKDMQASEHATAVLTAVRDANELDTRYRSWNRYALRDGDAYLIVWPDEPTEVNVELTGDQDVDDVPAVVGVNITYGDPRNCRMFYDPENPRRKLFFAHMWEFQISDEKKPRIRMNLFYADRIEKWISGPGDRNKTAKEFRPYLDPDRDGAGDYPGSGMDPDADGARGAVWPMVNPYGQVPVFHLRTDFDYGRPEHADAFAPQDALSKLIEMMMVTVEFNGFPQRYAIQEADSLGTQSIREDPLAEHSPADWDHDFTEEALSTTSITSGAISNETGSNYESNPGAMQIYKGFREVSQFQTANPASFLEPLREMALLISASTSTPFWKFQGLGGQTPSGEALRIAEAPLVQKARDRMAMFGGAWQDAYEFALKILNVSARVAVQWCNPEISDLTEVWQLVKLKIELGVPRANALMQAGVSETEAVEWAQNFDDVFSQAAYYQGRALMFRAQGELFQQQAVAAKVANGVPQRQALIDAGYPEADVDVWLAERGDERDLTSRIALFGQIAAGIQSLSAGVATEVLTAEGANAIVASLFSDLMPELPAAELELPDEDVELDGGGDGELPPAALPGPGQGPESGVFSPAEPPLPPSGGSRGEFEH